MKTLSIATSQNSISGKAAARYWQATLQRDRRADGAFVFAVRSTHIYCRPSCPARRPLRQNTLFFGTAKEAQSQGFRPCRRCKPQEQQEAIALVQRAAKLLINSSEAAEEGARLESLAAQLKTTPAKLRRAFRRATGLAPREFAQ